MFHIRPVSDNTENNLDWNATLCLIPAIRAGRYGLRKKSQIFLYLK